MAYYYFFAGHYEKSNRVYNIIDRTQEVSTHEATIGV